MIVLVMIVANSFHDTQSYSENCKRTPVVPVGRHDALHRGSSLYFVVTKCKFGLLVIGVIIVCTFTAPVY